MHRLMLKRYLEQRHIDLDSGRSCLALELCLALYERTSIEYWQALEVLAYEDGWNNWRDFFYMPGQQMYYQTSPQTHLWPVMYGRW